MDRRYYYWIAAQDPDTGRPYLILGGSNEDEARRKGLEMLGGINFEIKRYPTKDLGAASAFLRGKRLEDTHSLKESGRRIGHGKTIARFRRQRGF